MNYNEFYNNGCIKCFDCNNPILIHDSSVNHYVEDYYDYQYFDEDYILQPVEQCCNYKYFYSNNRLNRILCNSVYENRQYGTFIYSIEIGGNDNFIKASHFISRYTSVALTSKFTILNTVAGKNQIDQIDNLIDKLNKEKFEINKSFFTIDKPQYQQITDWSKLLINKMFNKLVLL